MTGGGRVVRILLIAAATAACRSTVRVAEQAPTPAALPPIGVYEISSRRDTALVLAPAPNRDPLGDLAATRRITLTSNDADARTMLLWLAEEAGVDLVVAPDVRARVSVSFTNVPAADALRAIMTQAGLSVLVGKAGAPWPPVVFHQVPVNINEADAATLTMRFGVTPEMAAWIVDSRSRP